MAESGGGPPRLALVGLGVVAAKHLKAIRFCQRRGEARLAAVVDPDEKAACAAHPWLYGVPRYDSLDDMFAAETVDLVAITTPSGSHFELAAKALEAGCHVLLEKPMTLDYGQGQELLRLAEAKDRKLAVGHIYRHFLFSDMLAEAVHEGALGRLLHGEVTVRWGHDQAYYDQAPWRGTYGADGGVLMNQTIHAVDLMQWLIGRPALEATSLVARQCHDIEAEDLALGVVRFADEVYLQVEGTTNTDPGRHEASFALFGERGELRASLLEGKIRLLLLRDGKKIKGILRKSLLRLVRRGGLGALLQAANPHTALYLDFLEAIRLDRPAKADGQSGLDALGTVLALYRSARERQVVSVRSAAAFPLADMNDYFSRLRMEQIAREEQEKQRKLAEQAASEQAAAESEEADERTVSDHAVGSKIETEWPAAASEPDRGASVSDGNEESPKDDLAGAPEQRGDDGAAPDEGETVTA